MAIDLTKLTHAINALASAGPMLDERGELLKPDLVTQHITPVLFDLHIAQATLRKLASLGLKMTPETLALWVTKIALRYDLQRVANSLQRLDDATADTLYLGVVPLRGIEINQSIELDSTTRIIHISEVPNSPFRNIEGSDLSRVPEISQILHSPFQHLIQVGAPAKAAIVRSMSGVDAEKEKFDHLAHYFPKLLGAVLGIRVQEGGSWCELQEWVPRNEGVFASVMFGPANPPFSGHLTALNTEHEETTRAFYATFLQLTPQMCEQLYVPAMHLVESLHGVEVERAINLGIALESLLLMGDDESNTEIGFRLAMRGAWLLASKYDDRLPVFRTLRKAYTLRSQAVHSGRLKMKDGADTLRQATHLCGRVLAKIAQLGRYPNWQALVLGGEPDQE